MPGSQPVLMIFNSDLTSTQTVQVFRSYPTIESNCCHSRLRPTIFSEAHYTPCVSLSSRWMHFGESALMDSSQPAHSADLLEIYRGLVSASGYSGHAKRQI